MNACTRGAHIYTVQQDYDKHCCTGSVEIQIEI